MAIQAVMLNGGETDIDKDLLDNLRRTVRGAVASPGILVMAPSRPANNAMHRDHPAVVVQATGTADVIDAINSPADKGCCGGPRRRTFRRGPVERRGRGPARSRPHERRRRRTSMPSSVPAQGGTLWRDVDRETQVSGLPRLGVSFGTPGSRAFTLGGGKVEMAGNYGLSCDKLVAAQVVDATGQVRTASANTSRRPLLGNPRRRRKLWGRDVVHLQSVRASGPPWRSLLRSTPSRRRLRCCADTATSWLELQTK